MGIYYDRFNIALEPAESEALIKLAKSERRTKTAQAAVIIRDALKKAGLLSVRHDTILQQETTANVN